MTIKLLTALPFGGYTAPAGATILLDPAAEGGLVASKMAIWSMGPVDWDITNGASPAVSSLSELELKAVKSLVAGAVVFADVAYSGTSNNATLHLQALIDAASAAYSASVGRVRLVVPPAVWMIDGLVWRSNVIYDWGSATIRKRSAGAGPYNRLIGTPTRVENNGTYYGQSDNIVSIGGRFESNGIACNNGIFVLDEGRNCQLSDFTVVHSPGVASWAVQISGRGIQIGGNWQVLGGTDLYQDGLHLKYGRDISVVGGYVESGDDALAFGWDIVGASQQYDDEALERVTVNGTVVKSAQASAIKVYYGIDTVAMGGINRRKVRDLTVTGITGTSGTTRNGGIAILDGTATNTNAGLIENVTIQAKLSVGSVAHSGVNAYGVILTTGKNVSIDADLDIIDTIGGATRFRPLLVQCGDDVRIKLTQRGTPVAQSSALNPFAAGTTFSDVQICDGSLLSADVDGASGIDINNTPGATMRGTRITGNLINNIRDTSYGVLAGATGIIGDLVVSGNRFRKRAGATTSRGYAAGSGSAVTHLELSNNDFSDVFSASVGAFNTNHASYYVVNNRGFTSRAGGTATITAAATTVAVTHNAGVRLAAATSAAIPQITVVPTNAPTNAIKWSVSVSTDTGFAINSDVAPGASTATFAWSVDTSKKPVA